MGVLSKKASAMPGMALKLPGPTVVQVTGIGSSRRMRHSTSAAWIACTSWRMRMPGIFASYSSASSSPQLACPLYR
jgi:hypothetical protein